MTVVIDGHVHIYPVFDRDAFFTAAFSNFAAIAKTLNDDVSFILALAEGAGHDVFEELQQQAVPAGEALPLSQHPDHIRIVQTEEPDSLQICKGEQSLTLIAGRQHVSSENIEVLSLCSTALFEDRVLPLDKLCSQVGAAGGIVVLPWGVGKWLGKRGQCVENLLEAKPDYPLFVGDNGNRPAGWPTPSQFTLGRELVTPLLSGSDPLPLASHEGQAGTSGVVLQDVKLSATHPAESLRQQLQKGVTSVPFGRRMNPLRFLVDQFRLRMQ